VLVGTTIGSGIFRVPATVAEQLQYPGPVLLTWFVGGLISLFGALTIAELAGSLPRSGGIFAYLLEAFGPLPAFLYGWSEILVVRAAALGGISTIFAEYLAHFVPLDASQIRYVAAAVIIVVSVINYIGIGRAAVVMNIATLAKFVALASLGLLAFTAMPSSPSHFEPVWDSTLSLSLMATALVPVMWTYDGWANLSYVGGEVRDPQRTLPLALIIGTLAIIVAYLLVNVAYIYLVPLNEMGESRLIAATAASRIPLLGGLGAAIVAALVMVSTFSSVHGSMMTGPRVFFAMADRDLFFKTVARVSPRFQTPSVAIVLCGSLGVIYVLQNDFAQLADKFVLGIWPFYAMAVFAVFVFRRTRPDMPRPYKTWGYPVVPALFLIASLGMVLNALWTDPANTGFTFGLILAGIPVYYIWRAYQRRKA